MGYHVQYGGPAKGSRKSNSAMKCWILLLVVLGLLCVQWFVTSEISLLELLIPGESQVTLPAINGLVDALAEGEPIGESVTAFCQQVFAGAA